MPEDHHSPPLDYSGFPPDVQRRVDGTFTYHAPTEEQITAMKAIREAAKSLAAAIIRHAPLSPDRSAAIRFVRQAVMTVNAGIVIPEEERL